MSWWPAWALRTGRAVLVMAVVGAGGVARAEGPEGGVHPGAALATARETTTVSIIPAQPTLTLGVDAGTTLVVTVVGPLAGEAMPARTQSTVGTIGPLIARPGIPGSFTAEYRVPDDRIPQSAIISVEVSLPGGARIHATTRLLLPATTMFPLRTSPSAMVSLDVAGHTFGPRRADQEGNVSIPIVVPPDVGVGRARATNKVGIATETDVDLQLQDYPRVLLIAPPGGEAGAIVEVEVWAVDATGDPSPPEEIDLRASAGQIRRVGGMPGLARFAFTLPARVGAGAVTLDAAMDDGSSQRSEVMMVKAGPADEISIASDLRRLVVGSGAIARLKLEAQDRFGNAVPVAGIAATLDGQPLALTLSTGEATAEVSAPERWLGRDHLLIDAALGKLRATRDLLVTGGSPARAELIASRLTVDGDENNGVEFVLQLYDARGTPTSATRVVWQADEDGTLTTLPAYRLGTYAVRFVPRRLARDRTALITVKVDSNLSATGRVVVESGGTRMAAARVGLLSNLGGSFGQTALLEATVPLRRLGRAARLFSAGVTAGYFHSEADSNAAGDLFPKVHLNVNQLPVLGLARLRIPAGLPVEFSLSVLAGMTFAWTSLTPDEDTPHPAARGTARAAVIGVGGHASIVLQPGELVLGLRYLHAELGRNSNGDRIDGNVLGLMCDLGFRMAF